MLLDPRYKDCDNEVCANGNAVLKIECMTEINECVAASFAGSSDAHSASANSTPAAALAAQKVKMSSVHQRRAVVSTLRQAVPNRFDKIMRGLLLVCSTETFSERS